MRSTDTIALAQTVQRVRCALIQKKKKSSLIPHISSRGTGSTFDISQHGTASFTTQNLLKVRNDCLQSMCTVKTTIFLPVYCILRLSVSTPVLNFPSRFLKLFKICNMLDLAWLVWVFVLYYLQSSRAVGLHLKEEWATMVPSIICMWGGLNSHPVGVVLIWACRRYQPLLQPWRKWNIRYTFNLQCL